MPFPVLETERLLLREITIADAANLFLFFSDPQVMRFYDCEALASLEEAIGLIQRFADWFDRQNGFRWGIALKAEPATLIGTCGLFAWHKPYRIATLGYELTQPYWRRGIMSEAASELPAYGFSVLDLNKIRALVVPDNIASAKLLERLKFQKEGVMRQAQFVNGKYDDLIAFGLLREEWTA
jgi:ribosomal-protein-alanine N-acetyltransferase